jgi:hypothetical protein
MPPSFNSFRLFMALGWLSCAALRYQLAAEGRSGTTPPPYLNRLARLFIASALPSAAAFSYQISRVRKVLWNVEPVFAELTQMCHCARMIKFSGPFVPHERRGQVFRDANTVLEHTAEIIHRACMAAIGSRLPEKVLCRAET